MSPISLAIIAYVWWGLVPIYWKFLQAFPAEELILYRVLFSAFFLAALIYRTKQWNAFLSIQKNRKIMLGLAASGLLIGFNWFLYVWAVNNGHIVDASLGYFINPLINMALGWALLGERLRKYQKAACLLAFLGVSLLVYFTQALPWIALLLAFSFAFYGLLRKQVKVETLPGTLWETLLLVPPVIFALAWLVGSEKAFAPAANSQELALLLFCGIITTIPLLAFAQAAKNLSLTMMGFFQFIAPTLQFLLGVFLFHEPFDMRRFFAFLLIWIGLGLFLFDLYIHTRKNRRA